MIITRTPLRISFVGGGSDLPAFYHEEPGMVVSATIDKYVYLSVNPKYDGSVRVSYSKTENVTWAREVEHELVRACLQMANVRSGIEVVSVADVPHGTGLGSSSSFTVGLLTALYAHQGEFHPADGIAHDACHVEIGMCHQPIGLQDQYAAAFGGLRCYIFQPDDGVHIEQLAIPPEVLSQFEGRLLLFDTGLRRDARDILSQIDARNRPEIRALSNMAGAFRDALICGNLDECGDILDSAWRMKRNVIGGLTAERIDTWYAIAKGMGAIGGKLCGAGGGGFMLFYAPEDKHAGIIRALGLRCVPFRFTHQGATVVYAR
jgi:D-glycero-alpha-D-manno-heptose-7-phosphate kinase